VQQYFAAGLLGELSIALVLLLLGDQTRLFENIGAAPRRPEQVVWSRRRELPTSAIALADGRVVVASFRGGPEIGVGVGRRLLLLRDRVVSFDG
jgi:hypothetical protein